MANNPAKNPSPGDTDRAKMLRVLIPAGGLALVVILGAIIASMSGGSAGRPMSDGSDGTVADPELKEVAKGVQIRDLKEGTGEACPPNTRVKIHYTGWLADGTVFDKSTGDTPVDFDLKGLIPGWQIGIPSMKRGGIRKLVVSPEKGYGDRANGKIPAGSTLIFEVELVDFTIPRDLTKLTDGTTPGADDPGLKELTPGVKYRDLKEGSGPACAPGSRLVMHYTGWLPNGTIFDSSVQRGKPENFELGDLIKGWQEGIPGMKPGGIRKLVISPEKGYGNKSKGKIPAGSTLIFEVEYLGES